MSCRFRNTPTQYGLVGRSLHWASVILLVILIVAADDFAHLQKSPEKTALVMQHASWGVLFLLLMSLRLYWRTRNLNPVYSYSIANWQKFTAIFLHRLIYFVVITQSVIGLCSLFFSGQGISFFGFFDIPSFTNHNETVSEITKRIHYTFSIVIYPLFAIHISAAIYHQLFGVLDHEM